MKILIENSIGKAVEKIEISDLNCDQGVSILEKMNYFKKHNESEIRISVQSAQKIQNDFDDKLIIDVVTEAYEAGNNDGFAKVGNPDKYIREFKKRQSRKRGGK